MRRSIVLLLVSATLSVGGCAAFNGVDDTPKWDQEQWEKAKLENAERLAGEDRPGNPWAWGGLAAVWNGISTGVGNAWDNAWGNTPARAARRMHDEDPDVRREGIYFFADHKWGRQDPYVKRYAQMADMDPDYTVRAIALRALNRSRDSRDVSVYLRALEDPQALVRQEGAKALANIPDAGAISPLIKHMSNPDEARDVRIACADALRNFNTSQTTQSLVGVLQDRDFGVSWQAHQSLLLITGQDFEYNQAAWLAYLAGTAKTGKTK